MESVVAPLGFREPCHRPVTHEQKIDTSQAGLAFCAKTQADAPSCRRLKLSVRDYLAAILPGLADRENRRDLRSGPDLTAEEREAFADVIVILSNFEELMGDLFTGYYTKHIHDQRKYFYLAWLLWAYIRYREAAGRTRRQESFYKTLSEVGVGVVVITFNYTDFFYEGTRPADGYFHGDCKAFIRFRRREYVSNNVQAKDATTLERMVAFIDGLEVDWKKEPPEVSLPAIVPPLAIKPIICTEYLDRLYKCGQTIKKAKTIVIVGYSFSVADEHQAELLGIVVLSVAAIAMPLLAQQKRRLSALTATQP